MTLGFLFRVVFLERGKWKMPMAPSSRSINIGGSFQVVAASFAMSIVARRSQRQTSQEWRGSRSKYTYIGASNNRMLTRLNVPQTVPLWRYLNGSFEATTFRHPTFGGRSASDLLRRFVCHLVVVGDSWSNQKLIWGVHHGSLVCVGGCLEYLADA